jgi:2-hydroxychromene-2-carboxylate isomerase
MEKRTIEFFFSPGSRYSYLAASQMARLEAETGCVVEWRPVSGTQIRKYRGIDPFRGQPSSGQYDWPYRELDARRWAEYYDIPFREPSNHRLDFDLLVLAAMAAKRLGKAADYGWLICAAAYGTDVWPLDREFCVSLAVEVGLAAVLFTATLDDSETADLLAKNAQEAFRRGAFGVPTFFVGDAMFWGNDRLPLVKHHLKKLPCASSGT